MQMTKISRNYLEKDINVAIIIIPYSLIINHLYCFTFIDTDKNLSVYDGSKEDDFVLLEKLNKAGLLSPYGKKIMGYQINLKTGIS